MVGWYKANIESKLSSIVEQGPGNRTEHRSILERTASMVGKSFNHCWFDNASCPVHDDWPSGMHVEHNEQ